MERYTAGWDAIRQQRFDRMQTMGLAPSGMELPPRIEDVPAWDETHFNQQADIAISNKAFAGQFDIINAIGVMFHLVDDEQWRAASARAGLRLGA